LLPLPHRLAAIHLCYHHSHQSSLSAIKRRQALLPCLATAIISHHLHLPVVSLSTPSQRYSTL
jgi:hypothetical protein